MLLPHDPLRLIALIPDHVPEPEMMTLVDAMLSTPIEAVVVDVRSRNGLLMLETLHEMRNDEIAIGMTAAAGLERGWLDFTIHSHSQIDAMRDSWETISIKADMILEQGGRHLFYRGGHESAERLSSLYPDLNLWGWDVKSPMAGAELMKQRFFGLVPRLWFSEEQTMTETILLGRAYREIVMYNP